jgi:hypothetical protein
MNCEEHQKLKPIHHHKAGLSEKISSSPSSPSSSSALINKELNYHHTAFATLNNSAFDLWTRVKPCP